MKDLDSINQRPINQLALNALNKQKATALPDEIHAHQVVREYLEKELDRGPSRTYRDQLDAQLEYLAMIDHYSPEAQMHAMGLVLEGEDVAPPELLEEDPERLGQFLAEMLHWEMTELINSYPPLPPLWPRRCFVKIENAPDQQLKAQKQAFSGPMLALGRALEQVGEEYNDPELKQRGRQLQEQNPLPNKKPTKE